jgi:hypothetical protein
MVNLIGGKISDLTSDFYGFGGETLCVECDDTISGNAYANADEINEYFCGTCGDEIIEFQLVGKDRH